MKTSRKLGLIAIVLMMSFGGYGQSVIVDLNVENQSITGFGGMNHPVWIDDLNEDQRKKTFGNNPGELGLSILRMHIDPNENSWNMEVPTATYAYDNGAILFASPWDPPSNLLDPNSSYNRLLPSNYGAYVDHLNAFSSFMSSNNAPLEAISIQNEPDYGEEGGWTDWTPEELVAFMKQNAQDLNDRVIAPESFQFRLPYSDPILNDAEASANLDIVGAHIYGGGLAEYPLAAQKGKEVWMTEHYTSSDRSANLWPDALGVGKEIHDCMVANYNAYVWWYIRRSYGLITDDGNISKRGYVFSHFSKFIRPGFTRVGVTNSSNLFVSGYKDDNSGVVIVAINTSTTETEVEFNIWNGSVGEVTKVVTSGEQNMVNDGTITLTGGVFSSTLPARSIVTFTTDPTNAGSASNVAPIAMAGEDVELTDEDNNGRESVTLDASSSTDSDGTITNYSWSMEGEQIGFLETLTLDLPTGSHEVILTITDDAGSRDMDTVQVTINLPATSSQEFIWLDAECAEVGGNWLIQSDASASNGKYVTATPGTESVDAASEKAEDLLVFNFEIAEAGVYRFWGLVRVPSANDDSFWVKMDDGAWTLWNGITGSDAWGWDDVHDSNAGGDAITYDLTTGSHTLQVCFREDGADLDKFLLTNTGETPVGIGEVSDACADIPLSTREEIHQTISVYPNPTTSELTIAGGQRLSQVQIVDMGGKVMLTQAIQNTHSIIKVDFQLEPGLYLLLLEGERGTERRKIIIE